MEMPLDYYDDGSYYYVVLRREFEVFIYTVKSQKVRLAKEKVKISDTCKDMLRSICGTSKIEVVRDDKGGMWLRVGKSEPDLCCTRANDVKHAVLYLRVLQKECKKDHRHSSDCVTVEWPYLPRKVKEEKKEKKEEKSQKSSRKST